MKKVLIAILLIVATLVLLGVILSEIALERYQLQIEKEIAAEDAAKAVQEKGGEAANKVVVPQ